MIRHFTTKVKEMNTRRGVSSGCYRKLADMVWTRHGLASSNIYSSHLRKTTYREISKQSRL